MDFEDLIKTSPHLIILFKFFEAFKKQPDYVRKSVYKIVEADIKSDVKYYVKSSSEHKLARETLKIWNNLSTVYVL